MSVENYLFAIPPHKIKFGLERTEKLLKACGNPQKKIESIQIVGTNGKGSTSSFLANVLSKKYKVGLFTSPHLVDYKERIRVNFNKIPEQKVLDFLDSYKSDIKKIQPSFFEIMTVLALWYFYQKKVDICVLETGLGGKLDSVTACENSLIAFTNIDLDHQSILGETIEKISKEKAEAINKYTKHVFCVNQQTKINNIIINKASKYNLKVNIVNNVLEEEKFLYLLGHHQKTNASLAYELTKQIFHNNNVHINKKDISEDLAKTKWPGRFQVINQNPTIIFDVAHNNAGIISFIDTFNAFTKNKTYARKILVCAFENNKNVNDTIDGLIECFDEIICTETGIKKSMSCQKIVKFFNSPKAKKYSNINKVFEKIKKTSNKNLICIIGTHYFGPFIKDLYNKSFAKI